MLYFINFTTHAELPLSLYDMDEKHHCPIVNFRTLMKIVRGNCISANQSYKYYTPFILTKNTAQPPEDMPCLPLSTVDINAPGTEVKHCRDKGQA